MDRLEAAYAHRITGLILLVLGAIVWFVAAAADGLDVNDLRNFASVVMLLAASRITHQMWGSHISTAYRVGRVERRRAAHLVSFPRHEDTNR